MARLTRVGLVRQGRCARQKFSISNFSIFYSRQKARPGASFTVNDVLLILSFFFSLSFDKKQAKKEQWLLYE
jgi:hypothetical protein